MKEIWEVLKDGRKHLLTGVSYMIPFVVAGGLMFALGVIISGQAATPTEGFAGGLAQLGSAGLGLFVVIMGGYLAYSIADRPGLAPGMIAASIANSIGTGFLGAMLGGFIAGITVLFLKKIKVPASLQGIMPIMVIPLAGSFISGGIIYFVLKTPLTWIMSSLTNMLLSLSGGSRLAFGAVNGMMYSFDLGGALNKTAYTFSMAMINEEIYWPQGINTVACATPPLGMALACLIGKKKFTPAERKMGISSLIMGLVGITEGAIPFAVSDPKAIIPSVVAGSAVAGGLAGALGLECTIAWDSFVTIPGLNNIGVFLLCIAVGCAVTAGCVLLLKKDITENDLAIMEEE